MESVLGESCDDGNKVNGDGCSNVCKVENGWVCSSYSPENNTSFCAKIVNKDAGYCSNGIVDGNEQCDDGFPLRNGDGCSTNCTVEPGWSCHTLGERKISTCNRD